MLGSAHTLQEPLLPLDPTEVIAAKKTQSEPEDPASSIDKPPDIALTPRGLGAVFLVGSFAADSLRQLWPCSTGRATESTSPWL